MGYTTEFVGDVRISPGEPAQPGESRACWHLLTESLIPKYAATGSVPTG
jgi:hypothetical protein